MFVTFLIVRCEVQDALVVTAPGSGAEIIPFLKTWVNLPIAMLFTVGYSAVRASHCINNRCLRASRSFTDNCLLCHPNVVGW